MLKDVTLGRYYPNNGPLHGLDPRTKLLGLLVYAVCIFLCSTPISCVLCILVLCILIALSRVPLKYMVRGLLPLALVMAVVAGLNIAFSENGLWKAFLIGFRMVALVLASNLVALSTRPREIADGLERSLSWLARLHVPVHDIATIIAIAFRFMPILSEEASRIMEAQSSRGAVLKARRARTLMPVLVPLFASAFRKADELAQAMDSRLYGTGKATGLRELKYTRQDAVSYICILTFLTVVILMKVAKL